MCVYGYARVSTKKQSIERQISNIRAVYPEAVIVTEEFTGTKIDRPQWNRLYKRIRPNDTVVFDEVSRMSRNAEEGFKTYQELFQKGVRLVFLKEPHINTDTYREAGTHSIELTGDEIADVYIDATNHVLMLLAEKQIRLAFETAQTEVDYLHKRTAEGIARARLNGKQIGQKTGAKLTTKKSIDAKEKIVKYSKAFNGTLSDAEAIKLIGITAKTYYKYKGELKTTL